MRMRERSEFRLRQLRDRHLRCLRRSHAHLVGVDCTEQEWDAVTSIPDDPFIHHAQLCSAFMDYRGRIWIPRVKVLCFGAAYNFSGLPDYLHLNQSRLGCWARKARVAALLFGQGVPIRNGIFHELTHAFMDLTTGGFPWPRALSEGYALIVDYILGDTRFGRNVMGAGQGRNGSLLLNQMITIRDALLNCREYYGDPKRYQTLCLAGVWLVLWLSSSAEQYEPCGHVCAILRRTRTVKPVEVYAVLQQITRMDADEMETSYREFATTSNPLAVLHSVFRTEEIRLKAVIRSRG